MVAAGPLDIGQFDPKYTEQEPAVDSPHADSLLLSPSVFGSFNWKTDSPPRGWGHKNNIDAIDEFDLDGSPSHWRDCHFADVLSPSLLKHLLKVEGGAAE